MNRIAWPTTTVVTILAALCSWVTLLSWRGFAERPSGFLVPAFGGCLLIVATGLVLRAARTPFAVVALGQIAVLIVWLNHRWATDLSLAGWVPTPDSARAVWATLEASSRAAQTFGAPVPVSVPEFYPILIVSGLGCAVLVDLLAVGLRKVPLAGLPILAAYTAPVSILGGVSWLTFALGAMTFLLLLAGDEARHLAQWGRHLPPRSTFDSQATEVSSRAVWSSARKIGFATTGLAVVAPLLVPTLSAGLFDGTGNGPGNGRGDSVSISNPMVDLKRDLIRGEDVDLLSVQTDGPAPAYLRISVLDVFDGTAWKPSRRDIPVSHRADGALPRPPGLSRDVPRKETDATIRVTDDFDSQWLPTPYPAGSVKAEGDWRYDSRTLDIVSAADGQSTRGLTYEASSLSLTPDPVALADAMPAPAAIFGPSTALPENLPASVKSLAEQVTEDAPTKFAKAVRLQDWFRKDGGFSYTLDRAPGNGNEALVHFLGTDPGSRQGYCEQFAAAMAVMGREVGIPSRVAVGFLRPEETAEGVYVFSAHDLHAWPEMYFEGTGWVRFEPTPAVRTQSVPAYTRNGVPQAQPTQAPSSSAVAPQQNRIDQPSTGPDSAVAAGRGGGSSSGGLLALAVVLVLLALAALPRLVVSALRRSRWRQAGAARPAAEVAWRDLRDRALDLGVGWDDRTTVRQQARHLMQCFGRPVAAHTTEALDRLVQEVERARFARRSAAGDVVGLRADVEQCRAALDSGVTGWRRIRADWWPLASWSPAGEGSSTGFGTERRRRAASRLGEPGVDRAV